MWWFEISMHVANALWVFTLVGLLTYYYYDEKKENAVEAKGKTE